MASRRFVIAFEMVVEHLQSKYPEQWPEDERAALVEEAKQAARDNPRDAETYYLAVAEKIEETGWH